MPTPDEQAAGKYKWHEIRDLPANFEIFRDRELESLHEVWKTQREEIRQGTAIQKFNARLAREWAIETGIIEGAYTLDRGTTQTLIEFGIDSSYIAHGSTDRDPVLVARIIQDHEAVLEGLFSFVHGERALSIGYIKELHAGLLRHVETYPAVDASGQQLQKELQKGAYKTLPNNPIRPDGALHEYCPPEHVAAEMDRLIALHGRHVREGIYPNAQAAWLHHAFTQIHPFQDGNGRVARALASLVFIKNGFFPLIINRDDRTRYITALEEADEESLEPLRCV